jgi:hypothetical protein
MPGDVRTAPRRLRPQSPPPPEGGWSPEGAARRGGLGSAARVRTQRLRGWRRAPARRGPEGGSAGALGARPLGARRSGRDR